MKKCLQCNQVYGDETNFCLSDGATLVSISDSFSLPGEMPTVASHAPFIPPIPSPAPSQPKGSNTILIAAVVGLLALLVGGGIIALIMFGLNNSSTAKKDSTNVKNESKMNSSNSTEKAKTDEIAEQKEDLKEQQNKLDQERQKLENERKALEEKKKAAVTPTTTTSTSRTATIIDPPSNVRATPNGTVICVARTRGTVVNILGSTGIYDNNGVWYYTDYCGRQGVIHSSQIRF